MSDQSTVESPAADMDERTPLLDRGPTTDTSRVGVNLIVPVSILKYPDYNETGDNKFSFSHH